MLMNKAFNYFLLSILVIFSQYIKSASFNNNTMQANKGINTDINVDISALISAFNFLKECVATDCASKIREDMRKDLQRSITQQEKIQSEKLAEEQAKSYIQRLQNFLSDKIIHLSDEEIKLIFYKNYAGHI